MKLLKRLGIYCLMMGLTLLVLLLISPRIVILRNTYFNLLLLLCWYSAMEFETNPSLLYRLKTRTVSFNHMMFHNIKMTLWQFICLICLLLLQNIVITSWLGDSLFIERSVYYLAKSAYIFLFLASFSPLLMMASNTTQRVLIFILLMCFMVYSAQGLPSLENITWWQRLNPLTDYFLDIPWQYMIWSFLKLGALGMCVYYLALFRYEQKGELLL